MDELIARYGYPAIVAGTFFEGETIVLIAGYLASRDYLLLQWIIVFAFLGSWIGDTLYFFIGRCWGPRLLDRWPTWRPGADRALGLLHRYHAVFILSFRFLYGLRTVSPFVIGMSKLPAIRFVLLNMVAAAIWASCFSVAGFLFGTMLEAMIAKIERYEVYVLAALACTGLGVSFVYHRFVRRRLPKAQLAPARRPAQTPTEGPRNAC